MKKYTDFVLKSSGAALSGASVAIYGAGTSVLSTIYSDNGVTTTANPLTTDSVGAFSFYAADGKYDIKISYNGAVVSTVSDVIMDDTANNPTWKTDASGNVTGLVGPNGVTLGQPVRVGQVATRCPIPDQVNAGLHQFMTRLMHRAMDHIVGLQLVIPNWYAAVETGSGGVASVTASVEYGGQIYQAKFSGSATGSIASGSMLVSDVISVNIPMGAKFYSRVWFSNATAIVYHGNWSYCTSAEDASVFSATTTPDLTLSTGTTGMSTGPSSVMGPCAIIANTTRSSVMIFGDSIGLGYLDVTDQVNLKGVLERTIGPTNAFINASVSGQTASGIAGLTAGQRVNRLQLASYCSDVIIQYGTNDLNAGRTDSQIVTDLTTIAGFFSALPVNLWTMTVLPRTTGTWSTAAGQTVTASEAFRVALNNKIRQNLVPSIGNYIDYAAYIETGATGGIVMINGGRWLAVGDSVAVTTDGLHPGSMATKIMSAAQNSITPLLIRSSQY